MSFSCLSLDEPGEPWALRHVGRGTFERILRLHSAFGRARIGKLISPLEASSVEDPYHCCCDQFLQSVLGSDDIWADSHLLPGAVSGPWIHLHGVHQDQIGKSSLLIIPRLLGPLHPLSHVFIQ